MKGDIGIMQGRLTEKGSFLPQQFPWENWKQEFRTAKEIGADGIEWMFNSDRFMDNPLWTEAGRKEIQSVIRETGICVRSVCVNFCMQHCLWDDKTMQQFLLTLKEAAEEIGAELIILPLFEKSKICSVEATIRFFKELLRQKTSQASKFLIETEEKGEVEKYLIESVGNPLLGLCYDLGNAKGKGKNLIEELHLLENYIYEVHIKDKKVGGISLMLGEGDVEFKKIFPLLFTFRYQPYVVLESFFGCHAVQDTKINFDFIRSVCNSC